MDKLLLNLPGKSSNEHSDQWLPLWMHLMDTAGVMRELANHWLCQRAGVRIDSDEDERVKLCVFTALVHDIGKIAEGFTSDICRSLPDIRLRLEGMGLSVPVREKKLAHGYLGEAILLDFGCPEGIASVVGSHHGKPRDNDDTLTCLRNNDSNDDIWRNMRKEWFDFALHEAGYSDVSQLPTELDRPTLMLISGLLIMADWIASNQYYFPLIDIDETGDMPDYPDRVFDGWELVKLPNPWDEGLDYIGSESFHDKFGFYPNAVQQAVIDIVSEASEVGILIIEAQMGVGKTEAALTAAEMMNRRYGGGGMYFGLPTQATANGIFGRLLDWAEKQSEETTHAIRLAHGQAELNEDYESLLQGSADIDDEGGVIVHQWFSGRKQALLANFVIGTVDQLLMAALKQKHVMLRHLGLAGKVVIVDECHAYDAYMSKYLDRALMWLGAYGVPVIILSATLPAKRRSELVTAYLDTKGLTETNSNWRKSMGYPLITWTDGSAVHQRTVELTDTPKRIEIRRIGDTELIEILKRETAAGGYAGVIVNTVSRAQEYAQAIREAIPDSEVILFHSQFVATDRAEIENALIKRLGKSNLNRSGKLIVVGTQVLEQSLDIDFDVMFTDLCPMDLLLQRIGRLHRREQTARPAGLAEARCYVMGTAGDFEKGSKAIYGEWLLNQTRLLLPDKLTVPNDIAILVQAAYSEPIPCAINGDERDMWDKYTAKLLDKENRAENYAIIKPKKRRRKRDTLTKLLYTSVDDSEKIGEAKVRDSISAIEVIIMMRYNNKKVGFLPWQNGGALVPDDRVPSDEEARMIARQKLKLPYLFCVWDKCDDTIKELERRNRTELREWQNSRRLKGELVLLIDENCNAELCGKTLHYDRTSGMSIIKEE